MGRKREVEGTQERVSVSRLGGPGFRLSSESRIDSIPCSIGKALTQGVFCCGPRTQCALPSELTLRLTPVQKAPSGGQLITPNEKRERNIIGQLRLYKFQGKTP